MNNKKKIDIILIVVFLLILILMIVQMLPLLEDVLENRKDEENVVNTVDALGWRGPPALVGLSALQVIIPLIPAVAVGVLTGLTYGVFWGPLIVLGGLVLGNLFVFFTMHRIDELFAKKIKNKSKHSGTLSKENLDKIKRPEIVAFFLFMIPFISGAGPYLFAETNVKLWKYIVAVVLGSLPMTILYVFLGDQISQGGYTTVIITASVFVAAVIVILIFRKKIMNMILGGNTLPPVNSED